MSTSAKVIIALLAVLVVTLLVFLIQVLVRQSFKPVEEVDPADITELYTASPRTSVPDETEEDEEPGMKIRAVDSSKFDIKTGSLVLVNKDHSYKLPEKVRLVTLFDEKHDNFLLASANEQLAEEAYEALCRMCDEYAEHYGYCPLMIVSAYRDEEEQKAYYDSETNKDKVEVPGYSDHHTGLGFDVRLHDKDDTPYAYGRYARERVPWIVENHKNYGFIMRYPINKSVITGVDGETNHFRYVGVPHSVYITDNNICLEEYLSLVKNYTYADPLQITVEDDVYDVWYCSGNGIYVPKDEDYTVSGDNTGGFIVTVKL